VNQSTRATASISTSAPLGREFDWTVERAGGVWSKKPAYTAFISENRPRSVRKTVVLTIWLRSLPAPAVWHGGCGTLAGLSPDASF